MVKSQYTWEERFQVVEFSHKTSISTAAKRFQVSIRSVKYWRAKYEDKVEELNEDQLKKKKIIYSTHAQKEFESWVLTTVNRLRLRYSAINCTSLTYQFILEKDLAQSVENLNVYRRKIYRVLRKNSKIFLKRFCPSSPYTCWPSSTKQLL